MSFLADVALAGAAAGAGEWKSRSKMEDDEAGAAAAGGRAAADVAGGEGELGESNRETAAGA